MSKKLTVENFIERSKLIHNNKYGYSKVQYENNHTKVCIICPEHGEFWQAPKRHLNGDGCPKCAIFKRAQLKTYNNEDFIKLSKEKYPDIFDYSKVEYKNCITPITLICSKHGEFEITPIKHLQNEYGCPWCYKEHRGKKKRDTLEEFIQKSKEVHGDKYDYSKVEYINSRTLIRIICPKHGEFNTTPSLHIHQSKGCPICRMEKNVIIKENKKLEQINLKEKTLKLKKDKFIEKALKIHGNRYDYSKVEYINNHTKICIICPEHGEFWQLPHNHLRGCNCPLCSRDAISQKNRSTIEEFIKKAKEVHGDKYDYSKVQYINNHTKVCIICPEHGEFWQTPCMHSADRQGCPNCATLSSKGENEIVNFIKENIIDDIIQRDKTLLNSRREIDIWIPSFNIAIEYNGLRWHSELFNNDKFYHLSKTLKCEEKGVKLIHIFEDEWTHKQDIVKEKLKHIFNINNKDKIYGRKCFINTIDNDKAKSFLDKFHIQGSCRATIHYGAFFQNKLIAVMSFLKDKREGDWELVRFASDYNYVYCGVGGKLFKHFIKEYNPDTVKSFADRRWTIDKKNNIYIKLGFQLNKILPPQYSYITPLESCRKRYHKFNFRKQILHKKYGLPLTMTEKEMTEKLQYYKIYDCGLYKYIWKKEK